MNTRKVALYQSLAACGAALIAFIGLCHEFFGHVVFPWGPAFLGGPIGWHAAGLSTVVVGLVLLGGTLRLYPLPVVPLALVVAAGGAFFVVVAAMLHHQFHMPALAGFLSGLLTAYCHRKGSGT